MIKAVTLIASSLLMKQNQSNPHQRKENNRGKDGKIEGIHYEVLFHASYSFIIRDTEGRSAFLSIVYITQTTPPGKKSTAKSRYTSEFCPSEAFSPRSRDPR